MKKITLDEAKDDQDKLEKPIIRLENCQSKIDIKKEEKINVIKSVGELFRVREDIIGFFLKRNFSV